MTIDEVRHLQRRLAFAATPSAPERSVTVDTAFNRLFSVSRLAGTPAALPGEVSLDGVVCVRLRRR